MPGLRGQHPTRSSCPQLLGGHWQVWPVPVVSRPTPQVAPVTRHCLVEQPPSAPGPKSGAQEPPGPMSSGPAPRPGIPSHRPAPGAGVPHLITSSPRSPSGPAWTPRLLRDPRARRWLTSWERGWLPDVLGENSRRPCRFGVWASERGGPGDSRVSGTGWKGLGAAGRAAGRQGASL